MRLSALLDRYDKRRLVRIVLNDIVIHSDQDAASNNKTCMNKGINSYIALIYIMKYMRQRLCGLGTPALTKRQEEQVLAAENRRKMEELRGEIVVKKHLRMKVVGSRLRWDICRE